MYSTRKRVLCMWYRLHLTPDLPQMISTAVRSGLVASEEDKWFNPNVT